MIEDDYPDNIGYGSERKSAQLTAENTAPDDVEFVAHLRATGALFWGGTKDDKIAAKALHKAADRIIALTAENQALKVIFRVNMLRLNPAFTHDQIDAAIDAARSQP